MTSRTATTQWKGDLKSGTGHVEMRSSGLTTFEITFPRRFGEPEGATSPEELIAAAHSSCLAMNLSGVLGKNDLTAQSIEVTSEVTLDTGADGAAITKIALTLRADVPGVDADRFAELARTAEETCPVSKALRATPISLDAALTNT
jgi:osmotically inducible protein OsmC